MRFFFFTTIVLSSLAVLGLAAPQDSSTSGSSPNPFNVPSTGYDLKAGSPTTFTWTPTTSGTVTLQLRSGASSALNQGTTIASSIPNSGTFTFTPPANTVRGSDYTIEIVSDSNSAEVNFTPQFVIDSSNTVSSATSASGSSTASTSGSSTSSASASTSSGSTSTNSSSSSSSASASSSSSASASSSSTATSSSAASSSASSTSSPTAQKTSAPTSGAQVGVKIQGGMLALVMGAMVAL